MRFGSSSFVRGAWCAALLAAVAWPAAGAASSPSGPPSSPAAADAGWTALRSAAAGTGLRVLATGEGGSAADRVDALERAGYHVDVAVLPGTFFVRPGPRGAAPPRDFVDVTPSDAVAIAASAGDGPPRGPLLSGAPSPLFEVRDVLLPPVSASRRGGAARSASFDLPPGLAYGTRWTDTSELLVGRVAVPIIFPESDGSLDPNLHDWTPALRDSVVRSAVRGFLKYTGIAASHGVPLTFLIEVHPPAPTRYEPISRRVLDEHLWIEEALQPMVGHDGDPIAMAYEVANAARARLGAHWAALLIVVQNDTDPDGKFADSIGEHAVLGGPYFVVMVQQSNAAGGATLDSYIQHEMTHMFWALDEYPAASAWWACSLTSGYFNQPNTNADVPAPGYCYGGDLSQRRQCFMKGNFPDSLCPSSRAQIGWVDLDQSGELDLFETRPAVFPDSTHYHTTLGVPITIRGRASDVAFPNRNPYHFGTGDSITVAFIDSIWHRLDGGPWVALLPEDGVFDEGSERFSFVLPSPGSGNHLLEFQAQNTNGLRMNVPASAIVAVSGSTVGVGGPDGPGIASPPAVTASPNPSPGAVRLALRGAAGSRAVAQVFDASGRLVRSWSFVVPRAGRVEWVWDGRTRQGGQPAGGVYFLVAQVGPDRLARRIVLLR